MDKYETPMLVMGKKYRNVEHCIGRYYNEIKGVEESAIDFHQGFIEPYILIRVSPFVVELAHPYFNGNRYVVTVAEFFRCFKEVPEPKY